MAFLALCVLAGNPVPDDSKVRIGGIEWYTDYDAALAVARKAKKPLWLHFGENPG